MATAQPAGQARNAFGRDHGNFATVAAMPNGSGNVLPSATVPYTLEAGDRCYLTLSTGQCEYLCISAGTSGGGDAVWVPSSGQGPWNSVLYVDNVRGSDATGQRGNANRPFATIQAAINAMSQFDTVELAPQAFPITATLTVPASVINGACVGATGFANTLVSFSGAIGATQISSTTVALWNLGANLGLSSWTIANMDLFASAGNVVNADGSSYAQNTYVSGGIHLINCILSSGVGGISTKYARIFEMRGGSIAGATISHVSGQTVTYQSVYGRGSSGSPSFLASYDGTDPLATTTAQTVSIVQGSVIGGVGSSSFITLSGQCSLVVDQTSMIGGLKGSGLAVSGAKVPSVLCDGYIANANTGVVDFASAGSELPDTATALTFNLKGTRFYANNGANSNGPTTIKFKVGGAAGNFQTVVMDSTTTVPGCTITADAKIHLTGRGASWPQSTPTTPGADGDIIPPMLTGTIDLSGGGGAKTWVQLGYAGLIRTGAAPDTAFAEENAQGGDIAITTKATTGLTFAVTGAAQTAANWLAIWK